MGLPLAVAATLLVAIACRSGAQVPDDSSLPVIQPTVPSALCRNDQYPADAPQMGDDSTIPYDVSPTGLRTYDAVTGTGETPAADSIVTVHYTGWLEDGCLFDSSQFTGGPAEFSLESVIPGWQEGIASMKVGGQRRLRIPSDLAYGPIGFPGAIPPNATLVFDVELLGFAEPTPTPEPEPSATPTP